MSAEDIVGAGERWIPDAEYEKILASVPILCVDLVLLGSDATVGLIRRSTDEPLDGWCLIGGAVLRDEPLDRAVERHLRATLPEMTMMPSTLEQRGVVEYFTQPGIGDFVDRRKHAVSVTFVARGGGGMRVAGEATEFRWVPMADLPMLGFGFGQGEVLRRILGEPTPTQRS